MSSLLADNQLTVQPGQSSMEGILADLYLRSYRDANLQLNQLPMMLDQGRISPATYQATDTCLCALIDTYAHFLAVLGYPQPPRPR